VQQSDDGRRQLRRGKERGRSVRLQRVSEHRWPGRGLSRPALSFGRIKKPSQPTFCLLQAVSCGADRGATAAVVKKTPDALSIEWRQTGADPQYYLCTTAHFTCGQYMNLDTTAFAFA